MIHEMIEFFLTPASRQARMRGFLHESIAFQTRAERNREAWKPHWKVCHDLVTGFCQSHGTAKSLAILGSGCLFEVPKDFLAQRFDRLVLVDQVFPRKVRAWRKAFAHPEKIEFVEQDLSDPRLIAEDFVAKLNCDLLISANLLSQVSLQRVLRGPKMSETQEQDWRKEMEERHLEILAARKGRNLSWTDVRRLVVDHASGEILQTEPTVFASRPRPIRTWRWNLAPAPEWKKNLDLILEMEAFEVI